MINLNKYKNNTFTIEVTKDYYMVTSNYLNETFEVHNNNDLEELIEYLETNTDTLENILLEESQVYLNQLQDYECNLSSQALSMIYVAKACTEYDLDITNLKTNECLAVNELLQTHFDYLMGELCK